MIRKVVSILGHSVILLLLHIVYFNLNWSLPLESEMMMMMNKAEHYVAGDGRFDRKNYLFINTAYDQSLIAAETEYLDTGFIPITDRYLLAQFFEKLAEYGNKHQYILCDILFDKPSPADSALNISIRKSARVIAPTAYNHDQENMIRPAVDIQFAQADYITYEGLVSKVRLYAPEVHLKTLPLVMYEDLNCITTKATAAGLFYGSHYIPRSIYPRYFFDIASMKQHEVRLKQVLDGLKVKGKDFYKIAIEGKTLIIGNFTSDMHNTFIGPMPGSLVLFNTYLTLQAGYHRLGLAWLAFALCAFAALSYYELFYKKEKPYITNRSWHKLLFHLIGVTGLCLIISVASGILFGVHITIIPVIIYFELVRNLKRMIHLKKKKT